MKLVQISDLHVTLEGSPADTLLQTSTRLAEAVATINAMRPLPDAVIASGDLVDHCKPEEYARLRAILAPLEPRLFLMVGNHDHRDHLRAAFPEHGYLGHGGFVQYTIEDMPVRIVALDSQVTGEIQGALCAERLDWLEARLDEAPERPTLVFLHHPPFPGGIARMDDNNLVEGRERFAEILSRHPNVLRVSAGHVHRPMTGMIGGVPAQTCPSTAHQIELDFERQDGVALLAEPPACLLHAWQPGEGLVTHHVYLGQYRLLYDVKLNQGRKEQ
ncbi:MAG: phosphodiesterase [Pseudomonadota bacterium]|nr:phosphodiesterase [Pseudomonadota bacterium]